MTEPESPQAHSSAIGPTQAHSPIVLSDAWKQLHLVSSPSSQALATPPRHGLPAHAASHQPPADSEDGADSSDDGFLSDHSEELHPETGFDPFLAATRRNRQHSVSSLSTPQRAPAATSLLSEQAAVSRSPSATDNASAQTTAGDGQEARKQHEAYHWSCLAKYWSKVVDEAMFQPKQPKQGTIDVSDKNITDILPTIADLSRFVALPPPRYDRDDQSDAKHTSDPQSLLQSKTGGLVRHESYLAPFSAHIDNDAASAKTSIAAKRTMSRSQSAVQPSFSRAQSFARTNSAMSALSSRSAGSYRDHRDRQATLSLFLGSNSLTRLPSALFQLQNLRVLSLRSNKLKFLPPAIGDLHNLSELHVPNNELQYLPAEILRLNLDVFTWFPNPYLIKPPKTGVLTVRPLLCHRAKRIRQQHSLNKLAELDEEVQADEAFSTTPVKNEIDGGENFVSPTPQPQQQPPPLIRTHANTSSHQQRPLDRTRSEMQVEGFLAQGIDQLRHGSFASISEQEHNAHDVHNNDGTDTGDTSFDAGHAASQLPSPSPLGNDAGSASAGVEDDAERERQRILEAAFEDEDGADAFDLTSSVERSDANLSKVAGRSRVLGSKQVAGLPSLQELCIRKLLSPYDVAEAESHDMASPFLSPIVQTSGGPQRRRGGSGSNRASSRTGTPLFEALQRHRTSSFGSNLSRTRSFSSNGGPEDSKFGKRIPTLLEAYENGTLQTLVGELGHGLVPMLEAARRSATQDWGTKARIRSNSSTAGKKNDKARTQPIKDTISSASQTSEDAAAAVSITGSTNKSHEGDEAYDVFGGVDVPGSLDRGDDACTNPWFSRCPNPKHYTERRYERGVKRDGDIALHRGKRGFGSTSSVSSLGTTLGAGKADIASIDIERTLSTAASSECGATGASPLSSSASSSIGTVSGFAEASTSHLPLRPGSQMGGSNLQIAGQQVRFASHPQQSFSSSGLGRTSSSTRPAINTDRHLTRPASTQFVRGFSTSSAFSASGLNRTTSFGPDNADKAERDWPLSEQEHRQAPIFSKPVETRLEWISHIGGIRVAKVGEAQVELDEDSRGDNTTARTASAGDAGVASQPSLLGAMGGFENKDLLPILWRGCSRGCLDFLV